MAGRLFVYVTNPCNLAGTPNGTMQSGPALATGAPGDRGPPLGPVPWTTSKFVIPTVEIWLNALAGHRSSGVTEIEKKLPLSATRAPYFLSPRRMAFSSVLQVEGMTKLDLSRKR